MSKHLSSEQRRDQVKFSDAVTAGEAVQSILERSANHKFVQVQLDKLGVADVTQVAAKFTEWLQC